jgi:hypothetical protein
MNKRRLMATLGTSAVTICAAGAIGAGPAVAHGSDAAQGRGAERTVTLNATLSELNGSGASGTARVVVRNQKIQHVDVHAHGLTPDAPHAQHIHYGDEARNECPTLFEDDQNDDGRLTTVEGVPAYGPVVVSLTTTGDTTPASTLAVSRYPVADDGSYHYSRANLRFTGVAGAGDAGGRASAREIAEAVRNGEGVVVIHGVDYDGNGTYSFSPEGASELLPSLPAEATDPAVCGILR